MKIGELRKRAAEAKRGAIKAGDDVSGWLWQRVYGARKRALEEALQERNRKRGAR